MVLAGVRRNESGCVPFSNEANIETGDASLNSVFGLTEGSEGFTFTQWSPVWHGNVQAVKPPSVSGAVRANALVRPIKAIWSGGWTGDFDRTNLAACTTPEGTGCTALRRLHYPGGLSRRSGRHRPCIHRGVPASRET